MSWNLPKIKGLKIVAGTRVVITNLRIICYVQNLACQSIKELRYT